MSGGEEGRVDGDLFDGELLVGLDSDFAGLFLGLLLDEGGLDGGAVRRRGSRRTGRGDHFVHLARDLFIAEWTGRHGGRGKMAESSVGCSGPPAVSAIHARALLRHAGIHLLRQSPPRLSVSHRTHAPCCQSVHCLPGQCPQVPCPALLAGQRCRLPRHGTYSASSPPRRPFLSRLSISAGAAAC